MLVKAISLHQPWASLIPCVGMQRLFTFDTSGHVELERLLTCQEGQEETL